MKRFLTFASAALLTINANAQTSKTDFKTEQSKILFFYKLVWQPDSTNANTKLTDLMRLQVGNSESLFESQGHYLSDSLFHTTNGAPVTQANLQNYVDMASKLKPSAIRFSIYKIPKTGQIFFFEKVSGVTYEYLDEFPKEKWELVPETKVLLGYKCQKAKINFSGRHYTAWFTRDIPISDGPYKFCGLPGLIVKIEDSQKHYSFELIKVNNNYENHAISLPEKSVVTTKPALKQAIINYHATLASKISSMAASTQPNNFTEPPKKLKNSLELH